MVWFRVDDTLALNLKVLRAGNAAMGLWVRAGAWSSSQLSDGVVPGAVVQILGGNEEDATALVDAGLWERMGDGYVFHDWAAYQKTKVVVETDRAEKQNGGLLGNHRRWHEARGLVDATCRWCNPTAAHSSDRSTDRSSDMDTDENEDRSTDRCTESSLPYPSHPIPELSNESSSLSSEVAHATGRHDVEQLLDLLDSEIIANGGKAPSRTKRNRDAMRLLLDRDGRTAEQVEAAIRWCQRDEFWRANILSAVKLRDKYDQLRLSAQRKQRPVSRAEERQAHNLGVVARMAALDAQQARGEVTA